MTDVRKPAAGKAGPNEGEGNRTAARHYNEQATAAAKDRGQVKAAADKAKQSLDSAEGKSLKDAEKKGLEKARH
jgi:hypothetical protein